MKNFFSKQKTSQKCSNLARIFSKTEFLCMESNGVKNKLKLNFMDRNPLNEIELEVKTSHVCRLQQSTRWEEAITVLPSFEISSPASKSIIQTLFNLGAI